MEAGLPDGRTEEAGADERCRSAQVSSEKTEPVAWCVVPSCYGGSVISLADEDTPRMSHQASNWGLCMDFNRGTSCPSFCDVEAVPSFEAELKAKPAAKPQVDAEDQADGEANKAFYGPTRTSLETSCGRSEEAGWVRSKSSCLSSESLNFHQLFKAGSGEWWLPRLR
ncbi:unnamed protein product, partial [Polarella glacialis]